MHTFIHLTNIYRAGDVKRYHTVARIKDQSIAEHSWGVAAIVLYLEPTPSQALISAALFHDVAESQTGDVPATFKWANRNFADSLEAHETNINRDMGVHYELTERELAILKVADLSELVLHNVRELMMGNRYAAAIIDRGSEALERYYGDLGPTVNNFIDDLNTYAREMKDNV
jgi:5'-deoxynucleotidase YfbR-like HD superfamily hydrolase